MRGSLLVRFMLALSLSALAAADAMSAQVVSTMSRAIPAVMQQNGFQLVPAGSAGQFRGDLAPVQTFEIVRPGNQPVTIGRLFTSCSCVRLESPRMSYQPGEPAVVHLRNIKATPPGGQNYAIYVQITSPIRTTLRYDTFVQSSQFIPAAIGEAPTRGDVKADGVMASVSAYDGDIELVVPKAENYIEDTSEYALRKKAEQEKADPDTAEGGARKGADATGDEVAEKSAASSAEDAVETAAGKTEEALAEAGDAVEAAAATTEETAKDAAEALADKAGAVADAVAEKAGDAADAVREKAGETWRPVAPRIRAARAEAEKAGDAIAEKAADAVDAVGDAGRAVQEKAGAAEEAVTEKSAQLRDAAAETGKEAARKLENAAEDALEAAKKAEKAIEEKAEAAVEAIEKKAEAAVEAIKEEAEELRNEDENAADSAAEAVERTAAGTDNADDE